MLNIILGKFLNQAFKPFIHMVHTIQESGYSIFSKVEERIHHNVDNLSKIISLYKSGEVLSQESGVILTPEGEKVIVSLLSELL